MQMDGERSARLCAQMKNRKFMLCGTRCHCIEVFQCSGAEMNMLMNNDVMPTRRTLPSANPSPPAASVPQQYFTAGQGVTLGDPSINISFMTPYNEFQSAAQLGQQLNLHYFAPQPLSPAASVIPNIYRTGGINLGVPSVITPVMAQQYAYQLAAQSAQPENLPNFAQQPWSPPVYDVPRQYSAGNSITSGNQPNVYHRAVQPDQKLHLPIFSQQHPSRTVNDAPRLYSAGNLQNAFQCAGQLAQNLPNLAQQHPSPPVYDVPRQYSAGNSIISGQQPSSTQQNVDQCAAQPTQPQNLSASENPNIYRLGGVTLRPQIIPDATGQHKFYLDPHQQFVYNREVFRQNMLQAVAKGEEILECTLRYYFENFEEACRCNVLHQDRPQQQLPEQQASGRSSCISPHFSSSSDQQDSETDTSDEQ